MIFQATLVYQRVSRWNESTLQVYLPTWWNWTGDRFTQDLRFHVGLIKQTWPFDNHGFEVRVLTEIGVESM